MKFWKLAPAGGTEGAGGHGFPDALQALTDRRLAELGRVWQRLPEPSRTALAGRRARKEWARRIAQHTGKPPLSEATIARRARRDDPPAGVAKVWLARWAIIDRAGGIARLAARWGTTVSRVRRWRDDPDPSAPPPISEPGEEDEPPAVPLQAIGIACKGWVFINGNKYPQDLPENRAEPYQVLYVDPAGAVMQAWLSNDTKWLYEALADVILAQVITHERWRLPESYTLEYQVEKLTKFLTDI